MKKIMTRTQINQMIDKVMSFGLSVFEHENDDGFKSSVHYSIIGGVRRVEFYPTTGSVFSNKVNGKYPAVSIKKSNVDRAIKLAMIGE